MTELVNLLLARIGAPTLEEIAQAQVRAELQQAELDRALHDMCDAQEAQVRAERLAEHQRAELKALQALHSNQATIIHSLLEKNDALSLELAQVVAERDKLLAQVNGASPDDLRLRPILVDALQRMVATCDKELPAHNPSRLGGFLRDGSPEQRYHPILRMVRNEAQALLGRLGVVTAGKAPPKRR